MTPTAVKKLEDEREIRVGWASWDRGAFRDRSVKFCYRAENGRISRASPEVPIDRLVEMVEFAQEQGEFSEEQQRVLRNALCPDVLQCG